MSATTHLVIQPTGVRLGDTIRMTYTTEGVTTTRTGRVGIIRETPFSLRSAEDGPLWTANWGFEVTLELLDRPSIKLPEGIGAVIDYTAGGIQWRAIRATATEWTLLREFKAGYAYQNMLEFDHLNSRLAEATEVKTISEGVVL